MFLLLGMAGLYLLRQRPALGLSFAIAAAICASFSTSHGLAAWPALSLALWLMGYRKPVLLAAWSLAGILTGAAYLLLPGIESTAGTFPGAGLSRGLGITLYYLVYIPTYLGGALTSLTPYHLILGLLGLIILGISAVQLWRSGQRDVVALWLSVALFSIFTGLLTGLGRGYAIRFYYRPASSYFWLGTLTLLIAAMGSGNWLRQAPRFAFAGLGLLMVGLAAWGYLTLAGEQIIFIRDHLYPAMLDDLGPCYQRYPLSGEACSSRYTWFEPAYFPDLAVYEKSLWRHVVPRSVLPALYEPGSSVVVYVETPQMNILVDRWLLDGLDPELQHHWADRSPEEIMRYEIFGLSIQSLNAADPLLFAPRQNASQVWFIEDEALPPLQTEILAVAFLKPGEAYELIWQETIEGTRLRLRAYGLLNSGSG